MKRARVIPDKHTAAINAFTDGYTISAENKNTKKKSAIPLLINNLFTKEGIKTRKRAPIFRTSTLKPRFIDLKTSIYMLNLANYTGRYRAHKKMFLATKLRTMRTMRKSRSSTKIPRSMVKFTKAPKKSDYLKKVGSLITSYKTKRKGLLKTDSVIPKRTRSAKISDTHKFNINRTNSRSSSHAEAGNIYLQNIGNFSVYGDTNCSGNSNRNILEKIFEKWLEMSKESGIVFFLTCGTLLGSYRNGELIPYDSDLDVLINRSEVEKLKKYESKRKFSGYENDFHVAIQQDLEKPYEKRKRYSCKGKVNTFCFDLF